MADIVLPPDLVARLEAISEQEKRSPKAVLQAMFDQYIPASTQETDSNALHLVRKNLYVRARQYWKQVGNSERLALTDPQLDEQFWLFDGEGIPRLKSEQSNIDIPPDSLLRLGQLAKQTGFRSGLHNIAEQSRNIVREELAKRLTGERSDGS